MIRDLTRHRILAPALCCALLALAGCASPTGRPAVDDTSDAEVTTAADTAGEGSTDSTTAGDASQPDLAGGATDAAADDADAEVADDIVPKPKPSDRSHAYAVFASDEVSETMAKWPVLPSLVVGLARDATTVVIGANAADMAMIAAAPGIVALVPIPAAHKLPADHAKAFALPPAQRPAAIVLFHRDTIPADAALALAEANTAADDPLMPVPMGPGESMLAARTHLDASQAAIVAAQDQVAAVEIAGVPESQLASSVVATQSTVLTAKAFKGQGVVVAEWDDGWANGDAVPVPPPPSGGLHIGLKPKVRARDHMPPDAPPPAGCAVGPNFGCTSGTCGPTFHATHVAGILMGNGAGAPALGGPGYAPEIEQLLSYAWYALPAQVACERADAIQLGAKVGNNSWGFTPASTPIASYGDVFSATLDAHIRANDGMLDVFAAGNSQRARFCSPGAGGPGCAGIGHPLPPIAKLPSLGGACTPIPPPPAGCALQSPLPTPTPQPAPLLAFPSGPGDLNYRFYTLGPYTAAAKNVLVVGAMLTRQLLNASLPNASILPTHFTSFGPTVDGRLAPQIVAPGSRNELTGIYSASYPGASAYVDANGTSMATPAVSGGIAQLLSAASVFQVQVGSVAMKALLMHTADDVTTHISNQHIPMTYHVLTGPGGPMGLSGAIFYWPDHQTVADGPDYISGYGQMNLNNAFRMLIKGNPKGWITYNFCGGQTVAHPKLPHQSPVAMGGPLPAGCTSGSKVTTIEHLIHVPPATQKLRVTMVYHDPPPAPGSPNKLVNDLDLVVKDFTSGFHYYPWQLDPTCPYRQAVRLVAKCHNPASWCDHRNNHEQVLIDSPPAGEWAIRITASALPAGPQPFSLWISFD